MKSVRKKVLSKTILYSVLILIAISMILPFYWSLISSIRPEAESVGGFSLWPKTFTTEHYKTFFDGMGAIGARISLWKIMGNTFTVVFSIIATSLTTCALAAYALARLNIPGKKIILKIMFASMMVPGIVTLIPMFLVVDTLGVASNFAGVILPGMISIYGVLFLRSFFLQTPREIAEAARIDGAGEFYIFGRIYIPLVIPGLITLGLFTFNSNWNSYLWPSIILPPENRVLAIAIREFQMVTTDNGPMMAGALITVIPTILIFLVGQRYFLDNLAFTGIK